MRHRWLVVMATGASLAASALPAIASAAHASSATNRSGASAGEAGGKTGLAAGNPFCRNLGKKYQASAGAQMFCFGSKLLPVAPNARIGPNLNGAPRNVNAANPAEDVTPAGARLYGQSETSIAASGRYVVEAWNDATTFATTCTAGHNKAEATGLGFSANGGRTFTDLGGLPNPNCKTDVYGGDPAVTAYQKNGKTYFYIASLYNSRFGAGMSFIAFDACQATGTGASARLHCGNPVIAASSKECIIPPQNPQFGFCSFLDKEYIAIDPARARLYISYSDFSIFHAGNPIDLSVCSIAHPGNPTCQTGTPLVAVGPPSRHEFAGKPYMTIASADRSRGCENEGAYPAVNVGTGAVYVAYEYNWATNIFNPACFGFRHKTRDFMTRTPHGCLTFTATSPCAHPANRASETVVSLDAAFIPGYNRFPASDMPRLAVSSKFGTVSMVWNDTRYHPYGDILMESFRLGSLARVQAIPVTLDQRHGGGLSFLPALRVANPDGSLTVSWFSRAGTGSVNTNLIAARVNPLATSTPANIRITGVSSNWLANNSDIVPNFGDYTDAVAAATAHWPFVGNTVYYAWSDGRTGVPQPFEAHL
jgi:hypothetical protein